MKNGQWMCDFTGSEIWTDGEYFDTKEEALEYGREYIKELQEEEGEEFYSDFRIGQIAEVSVSGVNVNSILDNVAENTTCQCNEVGEDYLCDVKDEHRSELEEKLNEVLFDWIEKHGYQPDFFTIENEETITL